MFRLIALFKYGGRILHNVVAQYISKDAWRGLQPWSEAAMRHKRDGDGANVPSKSIPTLTLSTYRRGLTRKLRARHATCHILEKAELSIRKILLS
jgi:hypothetical protein